jgi:hypothetical protein
MGAGHDTLVLSTQIGPEYRHDGSGDTGGYVDPEAVEHLDGTRSHPTGDDHVGAEIANEAGDGARLVRSNVWIAHHP